MRINNGIRQGGGPMRTLGGTSGAATESGKWSTPGSMRNFYAGEATVIGGVSIADKNAFPSGYVQPYCWVMAQKSGGMASRSLIVGSGGVTAGNLAGGLSAEADLSGAGDITDAALGLILSAVANLTGGGDITNAAIAGKLEAAAGLTGSGDITNASLGALADLVAALAGSGTATGDISGKGFMSADIVVTGDLLNTANVGDAVWAWLMENGFTAAEVMRIVAASAAGKSSGGPDSPVYRSLADDKDRITGEADGDGNRTSVSYDPS